MSDGNSTVEYRDVPGFPGYRVGSDGTVWTRRKSGPKPGLKSYWEQMVGSPQNGRLYVILRRDGMRKKRIGVHQLVALAFIGPVPAGLEVCHNDGIPSNNVPANLRYDTHAANMTDMEAHGTRMRGEKHGLSKLTEATVRAIRSRYAAGDTSCRQVARDFGICPMMVSLIVRRKCWRHVT